MEIEKKYLVKQLPENLALYEKDEIEQGYLCIKPTLRIRKKNDRYIFTYKGRPEDAPEDVLVADEVERPLTAEAYEKLREKTEGILIEKTRYRIPYRKYVIELDIFHGTYEGRMLAEVEFPDVEEAKAFEPPDWFGEDVSGDPQYTNAYMALGF